jgi:hypothetical protein
MLWLDQTVETSLMSVIFSRLASDLDMAARDLVSGDYFYIVGLADENELVIEEYVARQGGGWQAPVSIFSPSGTKYDYSPGICMKPGSDERNTPHLVAVVDGELWYSPLGTFTPTSSIVWESLSTEIQIVSAPDCVVLDDYSVAIVARSAGGMFFAQGTSGSFTVTELGGF